MYPSAVVGRSEICIGCYRVASLQLDNSFQHVCNINIIGSPMSRYLQWACGSGSRRQPGGGGGGEQAATARRLVARSQARQVACERADGARDTGAGPVLPRRRPWRADVTWPRARLRRLFSSATNYLDPAFVRPCNTDEETWFYL